MAVQQTFAAAGLCAAAIMALAASAAAAQAPVPPASVAVPDLCDLGPSVPARLAGVADVTGDEETAGTDPRGELNDFTARCLGMSALDALTLIDFSGRILATSVASNAEIVPSYARYQRTLLEDGRIRASYHRWRIGASVPLDKDGKSATFADLSQPNLNEFGVIGGYEYGRVRVRRREFQRRAGDALANARRDCLENKLISPADEPFGKGGGATVRMRDRDAAIAECEGAALRTWMAARKEAYFATVIKPQWKPRADPSLYGGIEGRYAPNARRSFFALSDPALTGGTPITQLPPTFPAGASAITRDLYSVRLYLGTSFLLSTDRSGADIGKEKEAAFDGSISYRRDLQFVAGTQDRTICPITAGSIARCASVNTAAPYELRGWVVSGRFAAHLPVKLFGPDAGVELRTSYAFDIDQVGVELPVYAFIESDGATKAGVALNYTDSGMTKAGLRLPGAFKLSFFLGRKFRLSGRP